MSRGKLKAWQDGKNYEQKFIGFVTQQGAQQGPGGIRFHYSQMRVMLAN